MRLGLSNNAIRRIARIGQMETRYDDPNVDLTEEEYEQLYEDENLSNLVMIPVESSNVQSFGYDDENRILYVRFLAKSTSPSTLYAYYDVEPETYDQFFMAPSKGKFVWQFLRDRYEYARLQ